MGFYFLFMVEKRIYMEKQNYFNGEMYALLLPENESKFVLKEICDRFGIEFTYPELLDDDVHYYRWLISDQGIGLVGNIVLLNEFTNKKRTDKVFRSLTQLEDFLLEKLSTKTGRKITDKLIQ